MKPALIVLTIAIALAGCAAVPDFMGLTEEEQWDLWTFHPAEAEALGVPQEAIQ